MTIGRDLVQQAFPNQPRMQAAFESLVADAEDATDRLKQAVAAIGTLADGAEGIVAQLAQKQAKNDTLSALSQLSTDPGVLEQIQPGIVSIRAIDTADTASLVTRALGDSRWLGGAHGAASAAKLTTARSISITGDVGWSVTFDGSVNVSAAGTIANDAVTYAKMQNVSATNRFLGRITAGTGDPEELTGTQATTLLDTFTSALKGLAPASGGGTTNFLRADGTWAAPGSGVTPAALTKTDDTNVTLTLGGTPATALLQAASITVGWTGTLAVGRGGTGIASYVVGDIIYASGATTLSKLADVATGNVLISGGLTTAPAWGKVTLTGHVSGVLPTANGGTNTDVGTAAATYTPTITPNAGAFTTIAAQGRWKQMGKFVFLHITILITTNGTASGYFTISAPTTAVTSTTPTTNFQAFSCNQNPSGFQGRATLQSGSTTIFVTKYDSTFLGGDGQSIHITGWYESA